MTGNSKVIYTQPQIGSHKAQNSLTANNHQLTYESKLLITYKSM